MTKLTEGHDSFVQSSKSSQTSSTTHSFETASVTSDQDRAPIEIKKPLPPGAEKPLPLSPHSVNLSVGTRLPEATSLARKAVGSGSDASAEAQAQAHARRLSVMEPWEGGFPDTLQLKGARVSTMFRGIPFLREWDEDKGVDSKSRSVFAGLR